MAWQIIPSDGFNQARPFNCEEDEVEQALKLLFKGLPGMTHATVVDLSGEKPIREVVRGEHE